MKKRILPFLTAVLVTLSGLTCQTDDICSDVQGSCLIIQVDAEIEAIPLTNATFETILTTATNTEFVADPDQSHYLLRSLPALWRLTNLPDSVTPELFTKLEVVARSASADGGKTPGEVIASGIVAPLSWTTGSKQRLEIKLAPVAKPSQLTPTRVPTSGGGIVTLT